jgi:hypothetical protein
MPSQLLTRVTLLAVILSCPLAAQETSAAPSYLARYNDVLAMAPMRAQVAPVKHLVIQRDRGTITLEDGVMYLLSPVGGRWKGAVFAGRGSFTLTPPMAIEQERLRLFRKSTSVDESFTEAVLLFSDSTIDQLQAALTFGPGPEPGAEAKNRVAEALDYIGDKDSRSLDPDLMRAFLNDETTGIFYAHMGRDGVNPFMFLYNPQEFESVQFLTRAKVPGWVNRYAEVVTQFPAGTDTIRTGGRLERRAEARIDRYLMDMRLPQTGTGEIAFHAHSTLDIATDTLIGPWVAFRLYNKLEVDSARWDGGNPAEVFKGKESPTVWVRLDQRLNKGDTRRLHLYYHGDLIDRYGSWFFVKSSIAWYPVSLDGRETADFDLTFTSPEGFLLASIGERIDSAGAPGHMIRTRWKSKGRVRNASFTLGLYDQYQTAEDGVPPVTVLWSNDMHRAIGRNAGIGGGKNMEKQVGDDVLNAMRFYQHVFGPAPVDHFYATEIPAYHGEAWPGIVGLSFATFHTEDKQGFGVVFRAHEVAHQWFGIGVDYATYRDRWLSEGFSNFAGLWYMQNRKGSNDKYFDMLDLWRNDILRRRAEPIPIWLGHRVITARTGEDYNTIVYEKGAWTLHMLRILLLDMKSMNEDRFTDIMRGYYTSFRGRAASTADFQRVVEEKTGPRMDWFFNQWVRSSLVPTYRVASRTDEADGKFQVRLRVKQEQVPDDFLMYVPVAVEFDNKQVMRFRVKVTGSSSEIPLPPFPARPKSIKFNDMSGVLAEVKNEGW